MVSHLSHSIDEGHDLLLLSLLEASKDEAYNEGKGPAQHRVKPALLVHQEKQLEHLQQRNKLLVLQVKSVSCMGAKQCGMG